MPRSPASRIAFEGNGPVSGEFVSINQSLAEMTAEQGARKDGSPVSLVDLPHMAVAWAEGREWHCRRDNALISMASATEIALQCPVAWRGFRSTQHKLVLNADGTPWLYFDLGKDPLEMKNLAGDPARQQEIEEFKKFL